MSLTASVAVAAVAVVVYAVIAAGLIVIPTLPSLL